MRSTRVRTPAGPRWIADLVVAMALLSLACKGHLTLDAEGRIVNAEHGYSIANPAALGAGWRPIELARAELAYSDGRGGSITMLRECRGSAKPAILARQLRIGIERAGEPVVESHPVELHGDAGWAQTFVVVEGSDQLMLRSVTLSAGLCAYDWVLVGTGDVERDASFERWWSSFRRSDGAANGSPQ